MHSKSKRSQISQIKIFTTPKMNKSNKSITYLSKSRDDYSTKAKTNEGGFNDEEKIKVDNISSNVNLIQYENSPKSNYEFSYDYSSPDKKNKILLSEKLLKREEISMDDSRGRDFMVKTPSNLANKFKNSKMSLNKKNVNTLSLSLSLLNFLDNNKRNAVTLSLNSPKYKKKNTYNKNINSSSWKHFKFLSEANLLNYKDKNNVNDKKSEWLSSGNLYSRNDEDINNKILYKNKSYEVSPKNILQKINKINEKIKLITQENNFCTYIKVNKKHLNQKVNKIHSKIDMDINESKNFNDDTANNNVNEKKVIKNTKIKRVEKSNRNNSQQIINNNVHPLEKTDINNSIEKNDEKMFDINKAENNVFLDKTYQNRFRKKTKTNIIKNDIFTTEKQKEYNTIIVKKKSNFLNNLLTINSTISTSNSSSNKSNNKNKSCKNWVYRLYNQEIKKQKLKNKIIYSLRKSILNKGSSGTNNKKQINKSKSKKIFKYNNNNFNFDEKFNVIDLFISDDKKINNRRKKKYKGFHNYQHQHHEHKMERHSYDDNCQVSENESSENNSEEEKMDKIRKVKIRHNSKNRKGKKFLFLYNEELINEEDEEKEKDDDE
jgi:hypothetical protein